MILAWCCETNQKQFVTNIHFEVTGFSPDMVMNRFITLHVLCTRVFVCVYNMVREHVANLNKSMNTRRVGILLCICVMIIYECKRACGHRCARAVLTQVTTRDLHTVSPDHLCSSTLTTITKQKIDIKSLSHVSKCYFQDHAV